MPTKQNEQQNIAIEGLKKDVSWIKEKIEKIENQVFNEIPHYIEEMRKDSLDQIDKLKKDFQEYKLSNSRWLIGVLVSLVFILLGTILNLIK